MLTTYKYIVQLVGICATLDESNIQIITLTAGEEFPFWGWIKKIKEFHYLHHRALHSCEAWGLRMHLPFLSSRSWVNQCMCNVYWFLVSIAEIPYFRFGFERDRSLKQCHRSTAFIPGAHVVHNTVACMVLLVLGRRVCDCEWQVPMTTRNCSHAAVAGDAEECLRSVWSAVSSTISFEHTGKDTLHVKL